MKQQDIAMIILVVSISLMLSFFVGNALLGGESNRSTEVAVVEFISDEFPEPDSSIFNQRAVNPTQTIRVGGSNTGNPFSTGN